MARMWHLALSGLYGRSSKACVKCPKRANGFSADRTPQKDKPWMYTESKAL